MEIKPRRGSSGYWFVQVVSEEPDFYLLGLGDMHIGSPNADESLLMEVRQWIKDHNCAWIGIGDYLEMGQKTSVGDSVYSQILSPKDQVAYMKDFMYPIKDKCAGLLKGNHEERANKATGLDPVQSLAEHINAPYCVWEIFGSVSRPRVGASTFYGVHHYAGHKNAGAMEAWAEREVKSWCNADVVFLGHSHDKSYTPITVMDINSVSRSVCEKEQAIIGSGHYLKRAESYIASRGTRPKPRGTYAAHIHMVHECRKLRGVEVP
jgi:hypothetical protein